MIQVRHLTEIAEFREAVRLQQEIWGFAELDVLPVRLFVVCKKIGGQAIGAFDKDTMVGFCVALPAIQHSSIPGRGGLYLHSNMLGVTARYRNAGVGRMLKLAQREDAVSRGFGLMEWTFDPLEIKNAYFNMERLGAVVRRFVLNFYGVTTSALHGGLPTDRCICEWHVASDRVLARLEGRERQEGEVVARIAVPNDIEEIRRNDPRRAREIQAEVSRQFQANVNAGLAATGVERTAEAGIYLFTRWES